MSAHIVHAVVASLGAAVGLVAMPALGASDPILQLDPIDPETGRAATIVPLAPWIRPGIDDAYGTEDDLIETDVLGDVDLVVRAGRPALDGAIPDPSPLRGAIPRGVAEPFGRGQAVEFVVIPSDGTAPGAGSPVTPTYLDGLPVLVVAFGDLDGDGYIGITELDGDASDAGLEAAELEPLAKRYALAGADRAVGEIAIVAAGPAGTPLRVALAAAAYAGPVDEKYLGGLVPDGPAVLTRLPFLPETDPLRVLRQGLFGLLPAAMDGRVALQLLVAYTPDPSDPRIGEAFTLRLDGSDPTLGIAEMVSGAFARFGVASRPVASQYSVRRGRPLHPGLDGDGNRVALETPTLVHLDDDGDASTLTLRVVPLDQLGNITQPPMPTSVRVRTGGLARIVSPDSDGDPYEEGLLIQDARGAEIVLDDGGGAFDDEASDRLIITGGGRTARIDLVLPDPDVDNDGTVDELDGFAIKACLGIARDEAAFNPGLDLDGNGAIDAGDLDLVDAHLHISVPADSVALQPQRKERKWTQGKPKRPEEATEIKEFNELLKERAKELMERLGAEEKEREERLHQEAKELKERLREEAKELDEWLKAEEERLKDAEKDLRERFKAEAKQLREHLKEKEERTKLKLGDLRETYCQSN